MNPFGFLDYYSHVKFYLYVSVDVASDFLRVCLVELGDLLSNSGIYTLEWNHLIRGSGMLMLRQP